MEEEVSSGDTASVAEPSEQLAAVTAERDQLQDLVMRRQAEFENFRKRAQREQMEFAEYASMEAVRALLPSLDDFERALKAVPAGEESGEFVKGVEYVRENRVDLPDPVLYELCRRTVSGIAFTREHHSAAVIAFKETGKPIPELVHVSKMYQVQSQSTLDMVQTH